MANQGFYQPLVTCPVYTLAPLDPYGELVQSFPATPEVAVVQTEFTIPDDELFLVSTQVSQKCETPEQCPAPVEPIKYEATAAEQKLSLQQLQQIAFRLQLPLRN